MEDTLLEAEAAAGGMEEASPFETANALGDLLREHKGADVKVLDLREARAWTDFFVIATISSGAHLRGLERHIKEFCEERGLEILRRSQRPRPSAKRGFSSDAEDDEWCLIDLGSTVVHLMSGRARAFYELERLWASTPQAAQVIYSSSSKPSSSSSSS